MITVGVSEGLDLAMRAILNPGDEVLMSDPCYVSYGRVSVWRGARPVAVATREEENFELAAEELESHITR